MFKTHQSRTRRSVAATGVAALAFAGASVAAGTAWAGTGTISPTSTSFSAPGTITVTTPIFGKVTCGITFAGATAADGKTASITGFTTSGGAVCALATFSGPAWVLDVDTPVSGIAVGRITGVQFKVGLVTNCGSASTVVTGQYDQTTSPYHLTANPTNQSIAGSCVINSLDVVPSPSFTVS